MSEQSTSSVFALADVDFIGMDLDHTLARYHLPESDRLIRDCIVRFLVEIKGYPDFLKDLPFDEHFNHKGIVFDMDRGNFLDLTWDSSVTKIVHGKRHIVEKQQIQEEYPEPLTEFKGDRCARFIPFITYFELPIAQLISELVHWEDEECARENRSPNYKKFCGHVLEGFGYNFNNFNAGWYFPAMVRDTGKYIYKRDDVRRWLLRLRAAGKRLFLVTNSRDDYAELLLKYSLGDDWRDLFDVTVVFAQKPTFFVETERPFHLVNEHGEAGDAVQVLKLGEKYTHGNWKQLDDFFKQQFALDHPSEKDTRDPVALYFGDHLRSDVCATKTHTTWLSAAILEEIEAEYTAPKPSPEPNTPPTNTSNQRYSQRTISTTWGTFFECAQAARSATFWSHYLSKHSDLTVPCLSVLAECPLDQKFHSEVGSKKSCYPEPRHTQLAARTDENK